MKVRKALSLVCLLVSAPIHRASALFNDALTANSYGAALGAGGASGSERAAPAHNPASLRPGRWGSYLAYHRPFQLEDVHVAEGGLYYDFRRLGFSATYLETYVNGIYLEQSLSGQHSALLPLSFQIGIDLAIRRLRVQGYRSEYIFSEGTGMIWQLLPQIRAGGFARNLVSRSVDNISLDRIIQVGIGISSRPPGESMRLGYQEVRIDTRQSENTPWRVLLGHSLRIHPLVQVTAGLANRPYQFSFGLELGYKGISLHQAFQIHSQLGTTLLNGIDADFSTGKEGLADR